MAINESAKKRGWGYDKANARLSVYVDGEEMIGFDATNNVIYPIDDDTFSLGKTSYEFDDLYIDGVAYIDGLGDDMLVATTKKLQFYDTGIYIQASADGKLKIASDGTGADDITLSGAITTDDSILIAAGKAIKTAAANNADILIQAYVTGSTAYASGIEIQSVTAGTVELGFFGKTPAAQQATEATVATSVAGYATINSLIGKLENLGLLATA